MQAVEHDIVIVGGGVIGATFALLAAKLGLNIGLIEANANLADTDLSEKQLLRTVALSPFSIKIFNQLAIWPQIKASATPYQAMQVWDDQFDHQVFFNAADYALDNLGYIVEQQKLIQTLLNKINDQSSIETYFNTKIKNLSLAQKTVSIFTEDDINITAQLVLGADGANSRIRSLVNIDVKKKDYQQFALVTKITTEKHHRFIARQRFLSTGPLAFLPLADKQNSVIWSFDKHIANQYLTMDKQQLKQAIKAAFQSVLGNVIQIDEVANFNLSMQLANRYISDRVALVGDAAHVVHPMAGQGVNLGLQDVVTLINVLALALKNNRDVGDLTVLRHYERSCKSNNWLMAKGLNGLHRLFSQQQQPLKLTRQYGLTMVNRCKILKQFFVKFASGLNTEQTNALNTLKSYVR